MYRNIRNNLYYIYFSIIKYFKHPTCKIHSNNIHPSAKLGKHLCIEKYIKIGKEVEIGDYTYINEYTRIDKYTSKIGKYCSIAYNVKIGMGAHPLNLVSTSPVFYAKSRGYIKNDTYNVDIENESTEIGHDVYIASDVIIIAGVKVGTGSVIAAGSVVTKDVPPYAVVAGIPAEIIKFRFDSNKIDRLIKSSWWDKDINQLLENHLIMNSIDNFIDNINY